MTQQQNSKGAVKTSQLVAVYIPFKTFLSAVTTFKPETLPNKLDRSAWPTFDNMKRGQTLSAFKFLGFIDSEGYVQPSLKNLIKENPDSSAFKSVLAEVLQERYAKVTKLISENGTIAQLQDALRDYGVSGTTLERAIRFWIETAKYVGVTFPDSWKKATEGIVKRRKAGGSSDEGSDEEVSEEKGRETPPEIEKQGHKQTVQLVGGIGSVTLIVSVNPIKLKGKTRAWFYELCDKLDECPTEE